MDPQHVRGGVQIGNCGVAETGGSTLYVAHGEVDGEDDGEADDSDDGDEDDEMPLEPDVLDRVYPTLSKYHVVRQGEYAGEPGANAAVHLVVVRGGDGVSILRVGHRLQPVPLLLPAPALVILLGEEDLRPAGLVIVLPDHGSNIIFYVGSVAGDNVIAAQSGHRPAVRISRQ